MACSRVAEALVFVGLGLNPGRGKARYGNDGGITGARLS